MSFIEIILILFLAWGILGLLVWISDWISGFKHYKDFKYRFFWNPKKGETYRNFNRIKYLDNEGNKLNPKKMSGRMLEAETHTVDIRVNRVYFVDENEEKRPCTFEIDKDGEVEIRIKSSIDNQFPHKIGYLTGKDLGIETIETRHYDVNELEFEKEDGIPNKVPSQLANLGSSFLGKLTNTKLRLYTYTVREKESNKELML